MKTSLKRLLAAVLAVAVLGTLAVATVKTADTAVMYNGSTQKIEFDNALFHFLGKAEPDLFNEFKNMMPGDKVTQKILVGTKNIGSDTVKMYLRVEPVQGDSDDIKAANADYQKLLNEVGKEWVTLTVKQDGKELAESGQIARGDLKNGVLLGTFTGNKTSELEVTLDIDINAGNELQGLTAAVDWVFTAEVQPYTPSYSPSTKEDKIPGAEILYLTTDHVNYIMGYEDGTVKPNNALTRAEASAIFFRLLTDEARQKFWATSNPYPDVTGKDWINVAVSTLTNAGILEGYEDGLFHPERNITRAELAAILARFDATFGDFKPTETFKDIKGHWAEKYISHDATRGWILGFADGTFRPDQNISRAQTVAMINRILERGVDEDGLADEHPNWSDNYANSWYYYDMLEAGTYHDYAVSKRKIPEQTYRYENWQEVYTPVEWAAMEKEWMRLYG